MILNILKRNINENLINNLNIINKKIQKKYKSFNNKK